LHHSLAVRYLRPVLGSQLVVVSDAHLGAVPPTVTEALLDFLDRVHTLGDSLLVNGDLFDFWFSYRRVIPREGFAVAAALGAVRKRIPVVMIGGNHDRWGGDFWSRDLGITFDPIESTFSLDTVQTLAIHGDGLTEQHWSAGLMHRITSSGLTIALWRAIHPDVGYWLADKLSLVLGNTTQDEGLLDRAAERQFDWARRRLAADPALGLVVMGHTHRAVVSEIEPSRRYLNPGAWFDGHRYAVATASGAELRTYS